MALLQVNYLSKALFRTVPLYVILPSDKIDYRTFDYANGKTKKYKTLYLLHGLLGDCSDWVNGTRIRRWAEEKNLAVVMPSGDNAFYIDYPKTKNNYSDFIGRELVEVTRNMFPLSDKREDTYIAGLSMGGYGALRNGIVYSDTFSHVAGFSSAAHIFDGKEHDVKLFPEVIRKRRIDNDKVVFPVKKPSLRFCNTVHHRYRFKSSSRKESGQPGIHFFRCRYKQHAVYSFSLHLKQPFFRLSVQIKI